MKKIRNPFAPVATKEAYNCFGCSPANEFGLHLEFWDAGDELVARWNPQKAYEGWSGILHGGIQATLMDEAAAWLVFVKLKTAGVTSELNIKYLKPVFLAKGENTVRARLISRENHLAKIECRLYDGEGVLCASAEARYFCYPEKIARVKYNYPGADAFSPDGKI